MTTKAQKPFELTGWHALGMLLAFFAWFIVVDISFAVKAYKTFPGEVTATPYEDGLQFNRTLAQRDQERTLGWRAQVQAALTDVGRTRIRVSILDRAGAPVRDLKLAGRLERPATETGRLTPAFTETRPGVYDAIVPDTPGAWDLTLSASDRGGHAFDAQRRLEWR